MLAPRLAQAADVVVLYSNHRLLPANVEVDRGLHNAFDSSPKRSVELFTEFLDRPTFSGPAFEQIFATYVHDKYALRVPGLVVVVGYPALDFLLRNRARLFTGVPVLHLAVDEAFLKSVGSLPPDVVGVPLVYDFAGTIELALRLHPRARRLVVVTGTSDSDRGWEAQIRAEVSKLHLPLQVEFLAGLPHEEVKRRLRELGNHDVVFTMGYFRDGAGRLFVPRDSAAQLAEVSAAPVYGPIGTFIGTGVVGGSMPSYVEMGRQAGNAINAVLAGTPPAMLRLPVRTPLDVQVDWNQVLRWRIPQDLVPVAATLHFKQPTFWEAYRTHVIVIATILLVQAASIVALLIERRLRRRTASALEESEKSMSLAASAAGLSVWAWDPIRDRFWMSDRFGQRDGQAPQPSATLREALDVVHPADREPLDRALRQAAAADRELDIEYRVLEPDGDVRWFAARGRAAAQGDDRLRGVALDITARKAAELQATKDRIALTHMTRVSTLGQLSASIAHQLNQPLAAILGNAEVASTMLSQSQPDVAELKEICQDIIKDDSRAAEVIRRLSALYKRGEMKLAPLDINELVTETLELLRTELMTRHVATIAELAPTLPAVDGERVQLQQVLLNLILNAAEAMSGVEAARRRLIVRTQLEGSNVCVDVIDTGVGITPQSLDAVFDAFWSSKEGGTGVGLAICRSIVTAHRGTLSASNNPDGACFRASWPFQLLTQPAVIREA
jgi:C4-dicarboxylate-specific signal transduction histidine kinase